jgi:hypothetical protein
MKATILKTGDFIREAEITRIGALEDCYHLEFSSILQTAKDPQAVQKNFGLIMKRDELQALSGLLSAALQPVQN